MVDDGPVAYRSPLPLANWAERLREAQIPADVSYHAGTYLCNATMYFSCYVAERLALKTQSAFIHLPLDVTQTATEAQDMAALPADISAEALRLILAEIGAGA